MHVATAELLSRVQAARYLSLAPTTLRRWASTGKGPRYVRSGDVRGKVLYAVADLDQWLEGRKFDPASRHKESPV